jgi:hypothetical protein
LLLLQLLYLHNQRASGAPSIVGNASVEWLAGVMVGGSALYVALMLSCGWRTKGWLAGRIYLAAFSAISAVMTIELFSGNWGKKASAVGVWHAIVVHAEEMGCASLLAVYSVALSVSIVRARPRPKGTRDDR